MALPETFTFTLPILQVKYVSAAVLYDGVNRSPYVLAAPYLLVQPYLFGYNGKLALEVRLL